MTDRDIIATYLKCGRNLTTSFAANELGIFGLPRLIAQLRRLGWEIDGPKVGAVNSTGDRVSVCEYRMRTRVKERREWPKNEQTFSPARRNGEE